MHVLHNSTELTIFLTCSLKTMPQTEKEDIFLAKKIFKGEEKGKKATRIQSLVSYQTTSHRQFPMHLLRKAA